MKRAAVSLLLIISVLLLMPAPVLAAFSRHERGRLVVLSQNERLGDTVSKLADKDYGELARRFSYYPSHRLTIYVFTTDGDFREFATSPDTVGEANPNQPEVRLLGTTPNLPMVIRHELVHIFFLGSLHRPQEVPFWFSEGLAIYLSRPGRSNGDYERLAFESKVPSLNSSYLRSHQTSVSSAQGYIVVRFMAEKWGEAKVMQIVKRLQAGERFDQALTSVLKIDSAELDQLWQRYGASQRSSMRWMVLSDTGWLVMGLLSLVASGVWLTRRLLAPPAADDDDEADPDDSDYIPEM